MGSERLGREESESIEDGGRPRQQLCTDMTQVDGQIRETAALKLDDWGSKITAGWSA
jgi:hypothetical protein